MHTNFININLVILLIGPATLALGIWARYLVPLNWGRAFVSMLASNAIVLLYCLHEAEHSRMMPREGFADPDSAAQQAIGMLICACFAVGLGIMLVVKVYRAVILEGGTPQERMAGLAGVRAWLGPMNIVTVVVVAFAAMKAFDWDFVGVFLAGTGALMMGPLVTSVTQQQPGPTDSSSSQAAPEERQRVLALVESGKIGAEDGAELLNSLAQSHVAAVETAGYRITRPRRWMLLGALLLLVGFFLPWFTENLSAAVTSMVNGMQQAMPFQPAPGQPNINLSSPLQSPTLETVNMLILRGGDVRNGLGWIALATGVLAAVLPFFWPENARDSRPIRNVTFVALGVGTVAILYLLSNSLNPVTTIEPGFYLAMAGFVLLWLGCVREYVALRPHMQAHLTTA